MSRPVDRYLAFLNNNGDILVVSAMILIAAGVFGMYLHFGEPAGRLGRSGLMIAGIGSVGTFMAMIASMMVEADYLWGVMTVGVILTFLGLTIFGLAAVKTHFLPRWNFVPVFTGIWLPLLVVASLIYKPLTGEWLDIPVIDFLAFGCTAVGLFALGYLLQSEKRVEARPAV